MSENNSTYTIELHNHAGRLGLRTANLPEQAAEQAVELIREAGVLYGGDKVIVTER